jgi:signal transduction histidine kinase
VRILHKLVLAQLAAVLLVAATAWFAISTVQRPLEETLGRTRARLAAEILDQVDRHLYGRLEALQAYAQCSPIQECLARSNDEFAGLEDVTAYIAAANDQWEAAPPDRPTALMAHLLGLGASRELAAHAGFYTEKYGTAMFGELFVTNRYGAVAALSGRTEDFQQDDEEWWIRARSDGYFVGDLDYDTSAGVHSVDLGIRIDGADGEFMGVMKAVLTIDDVVATVREAFAPGGASPGAKLDYALVTHDDRRVCDSAGGPILARVPDLPPEVAGLMPGDQLAFPRETPAGNTVLLAMAKSRGHRDFAGLGWVLILEQDAAAVYAPVAAIRARMLIFSACVGLAAVLVGVVVSLSISTPLARLRHGVETVGTGDLTHRVGITTDDEVGEVARAFDAMAEELQSVTVSRDELEAEVARRARAEQGLQTVLDELERSNTELEQFAYVASHDLQEPLRKVRAFGDRLASMCGDRLDEKERDYLARMQSAAERMSALISDLLQLSRVTTRGRPFEPVDLRSVADDVLADLELRVQELDAEVEVGDLPTIDADPVQMRELLQNLISNALKFHRPGVRPRVEVLAEVREDPTDGWLCELRVSDNGIGFDMDYIDRIFVVFQRLHSRGDYPGTGIGLAVCKKIAERHGGSITAVGKPGEGSTFIATLPLEHAPEVEAPAADGSS